MSASAPPTPTRLPTRDEVLAQAGDENFTVASALLGRRRQAHLMAIYGYARLVDDVGDEVPGDRQALLDALETELEAIYRHERPQHPVMQTLSDTIHACDLPIKPFKRLLEANRQDQRVAHYETFEQLLEYCDLSAAPVGELVLHVFGAATPERIRLSDRICAGLQVVEHLQDIKEDYGRGRIYIPREDMARFGVTEDGLATRLPRALIDFEASRAHALIDQGAPLTRTLPLRPRLAVAGFIAGGRAALRALPSSKPGKRAFALAFAKAVTGR
jgi:squalene synthase HpnC